jgi:type III restriction enzyme
VLIDSEQLESGDALDDDFRDMAAVEIEQFRSEIVERTGDRRAAEGLSDQDLLREVMNTVGRQGRLGGSIRCVVSVSMLTEGWDANTVTHVLGVPFDFTARPVAAPPQPPRETVQVRAVRPERDALEIRFPRVGRRP